MPTVFDRFKEYQKRPDAVHFSKKRWKFLTNLVKHIYDRHDNPPIEYVDFNDGEQTYQVRNYPISYQNTIDGLINKIHLRIINMPPPTPPKPKPIPIQTEKRARKRIPYKK